MAANGHLPASMLGPIPGSNAGLRMDAALAYTAMHHHSLKVTGVSLHIVDGDVGRAYRNFARQVLAKQIYGDNAATPGQSNHGWALAVDLMNSAQIAAVARVGAAYGWQKRCSDASWEPWHHKYEPGCTGATFNPQAARPDPLRKLGKRQRAAAERLLFHRREAIREARTGKGPLYRGHVKWRNWWRKRVEKLHRRASGERKAVLGRVLADRNGVL